MQLVGQVAELSESVKTITEEAIAERLGKRPDNETFGQRAAWLKEQLKPFNVDLSNDGGGYVLTINKTGKTPLIVPVDCFGDAVAYLITMEAKQGNR